MKIGIVCYPTYGGSGVIATELGLGLARKGHQIHFAVISELGSVRILYWDRKKRKNYCISLIVEYFQL